MKKTSGIPAFPVIVIAGSRPRLMKIVSLCCAISLLSALFTGCVSTKGMVEQKTEPDRSKAYLLGNFELTKASRDFGLAISVVNAAGKSCYLQFIPKGTRCYAVAIDPGKYTFGKMYLYGILHQSMSNKALVTDNTIMANGFTAQAGEVVYIGDFTGSVTMMRQYEKEIFTYQIWGKEGRFQERKQWFVKTYPKFSGLKFVDALKK